MNRPFVSLATGWFLVFALVLSSSGCLTGILPGENGRILRNLAKEYYDIGQAYATQNQYEKAISYYELASRSRDFRRPAQYQIARMNALASKWGDAEIAYRALLRSDRTNTDLRTSLAYVLAQGGKLEEAAALYTTLLGENPYNEGLMENYLRVLVGQKNAALAATELAHFAERFPQSASISALTTAVTGIQPVEAAAS
jgi:tetratricopeptide (TPR) repeat protein